MIDVIIIGGGVSGCAAARELSRYDLSICLLEKEEDVCTGTSKANSALVHAGFDARPGSLMAELNVRGSKIMKTLAKELDFSYKNNGAMVLCLKKDDLSNLEALRDRGIQNGVEELQIISAQEARALEPNISDDVYAALLAPSAGIVCPFGLTIAFAENAAANGVKFCFDTEVTGLQKKDGHWEIQSAAGNFESRYVINAAGVYADVFHNLACTESANQIHITPRRGDYFLLDKTTGGTVTRTIFQLPGKYGKGVVISPTVHGNTIVGPTAIDIENKEGVNTTGQGLDQLREKARQSVKNLPLDKVITSFAGLRAHEDREEFVIDEVQGAPGLIDCAGIESPGLSSAPAIGERIAEIIREKDGLKQRADFNPIRKGILDPKNLSPAEHSALIKENPAYGAIICRCEMITEGEIIDAITRPLGAKSLDGVKRRVRPGMGRCQGGFCSPKVMEILARERKVPIESITKSGGRSLIITGINKDKL